MTDTKDFMNSKIEALEQKITELEAIMPVYLGYNINFGVIFVPKDADYGFFGRNVITPIRHETIARGSSYHSSNTFISLQKLYSLPNLRGIRVEKTNWGAYIINLPFEVLEEDDKELVSSGNVDALNSKYPGLFTK
jgi:hypothetical protein